MSEKNKLLIRGLFGGLSQVILFAALLLIPADTWNWPRAIQFLCGYGVVTLISIVLLAHFAPSSLEARLEPPMAKSQPTADRIITFVLIVAILLWFVFIPIDVFRLKIFPAPGYLMSIVGVIVCIAGYLIMLIALFQNAFATPIVRDQSARDQVLVDTGLYALVRHPFYLGVILFFVGTAIWLQSYAGALALSVIVLILFARIWIEEKTLREHLTGYSGYVRRVRYRLIPYIW